MRTVKYKVWNNNCKNNIDKDICYLKLNQENGDVLLDVVDKNGETIDNSTLLVINDIVKGVLLCNYINPDVPIKTDFSDCVLVMTTTHYTQLLLEQKQYDIVSAVAENIKRKEKENVTIQ